MYCFFCSKRSGVQPMPAQFRHNFFVLSKSISAPPLPSPDDRRSHVDDVSSEHYAPTMFRVADLNSYRLIVSRGIALLCHWAWFDLVVSRSPCDFASFGPDIAPLVLCATQTDMILPRRIGTRGSREAHLLY
jgi:hypothetical protein